MYSRNRYGGNWYQAAFWLIIGILIGQFLRFDINLAPRKTSQLAPSQFQIAQTTPGKTNAD